MDITIFTPLGGRTGTNYEIWSNLSKDLGHTLTLYIGQFDTEEEAQQFADTYPSYVRAHVMGHFTMTDTYQVVVAFSGPSKEAFKRAKRVFNG